MTSAVRIVVQDPSASGLGIAIGLVELGHAVTYRTSRATVAREFEASTRLSQRLRARYFGEHEATDDAAHDGDLVIAVDVFADFLDGLDRGIGATAPMDAADPFVTTRNPLVYPERLRRWLHLVGRAPRAVVVDLSDAATPHEIAFESMSHVTLLARETRRVDDVWRPFPYLYNNVLLAIEHLHAQHEWWRPTGRRQHDADWTFCGTLHHPRYGTRRTQAIANAAGRWPQRRGHVAIAAPFVDVLHLLQSTRYCLDLPGAGELCFRLHEALALGTPLLRLEPVRLPLPDGLAEVVTCEPGDFTAADAEYVRALYLRHYAPRAAAEAVLAAVSSPQPVIAGG